MCNDLAEAMKALDGKKRAESVHLLKLHLQWGLCDSRRLRKKAQDAQDELFDFFYCKDRATVRHRPYSRKKKQDELFDLFDVRFWGWRRL